MDSADKNSFSELMLGLGELYGKEIKKPLIKIKNVYFCCFFFICE